jgi:hypothetical protein
MIKESLLRVLREERLTLCEIMIPRVSKQELDEVHITFGTPGKYKEDDFTDVTDLVKQ